MKRRKKEMRKECDGCPAAGKCTAEPGSLLCMIAMSAVEEAAKTEKNKMCPHCGKPIDFAC